MTTGISGDNKSPYPVSGASVDTASPTRTPGTQSPLSVDNNGSVRAIQMNPDGTPIDTTLPQTIQGNQIGTATTSQVAVSTSAVLLFASGTSVHHKGISNPHASVPLYYGFSSGVTTGTGMYLAPGGYRAFDVSVPVGDIYGIAASAITVTVEGW